MIMLAIDPGYGNCGWVLFVNGEPKKWGGWLGDNSFTKQSVDTRCYQISSVLRALIDMYGVDVVATEAFFGGRQPAPNYNRGRFDLWYDLATGHLHRYYINPVNLKMWVAGRGKVTKEDMSQEISTELDRLYPDFHKTITGGARPSVREHVYEAYAIGRFAICCETIRRGVAVSYSLAHRDLCAREFNKGNPRPPIFEVPCEIPVVMAEE